jgi:hypothetical protein
MPPSCILKFRNGQYVGFTSDLSFCNSTSSPPVFGDEAFKYKPVSFQLGILMTWNTHSSNCAKKQWQGSACHDKMDPISLRRGESYSIKFESFPQALPAASLPILTLFGPLFASFGF